MSSIVADKTDEDNRKRIFRCRFTLKPRKYNSRELYYLVMVDDNGIEKARVEFQIDIALNLDTVDYFSLKGELPNEQHSVVVLLTLFK